MARRCPECNQIIQEPGTENQNRAMHALLTEYYKTGMHSAPEGYTLPMFKVYMKLQYGPDAYEMEFKGKSIMVPKSWSNYTKRERMVFIDGLLAEIFQTVRPLTWKLQEIIQGMEYGKEEQLQTAER